MGGDTEQFCPWALVRAMHPPVRVITTELKGRLRGCVDLSQRIIWLDARLTSVQARCVLAFEVGQLLRGPLPEDPCAAAAHRRDCEEWAARQLIALPDLLDGFRLFVDLPTIAGWLNVDLPTLRSRLRGLTDAEQDAAMAAIHAPKAVA